MKTTEELIQIMKAMSKNEIEAIEMEGLIIRRAAIIGESNPKPLDVTDDDILMNPYAGME